MVDDVSRELLPEPWGKVLAQKGITSKRGLATKAGLSPQTAKRLIDGEGMPSPQTVAAVADALFNGDRTYVWTLAGQERQDHGDFQLPPEASQLDPEQRAAVLAVVKAMLPKESRGGGHGGNTAPTKFVGPTSDEAFDEHDVTKLAARKPGTPSRAQQVMGRGLDDL